MYKRQALFADGFGFTDLAGLCASIKPRTVDVRGGNVAQPGAPGIELAVSQAIYRIDATVRRAAALQAHPLTVGAAAVLHPETAATAGLVDGAMGKFSNTAGTATLPVGLSDKVSTGVVWVESGYGATAPLAASRVEVKCA